MTLTRQNRMTATCPEKWAPFVIGVIVGFGAWKPLTIVLVGLVLHCLASCRRLQTTVPKSQLLLIATTLLLLTYWILFSFTDTRFIDQIELLVTCVAIYLATRMTKGEKDAHFYILALAIGMLVYSSLVILNTMQYHPPPYYNLVLDPFTGDEMNSPGVANRAALVFVYIVTYQSLYINALTEKKQKYVFRFILALTLLWVFYIGIITGSRTFALFLALAIVPLVFQSNARFTRILVKICIVIAGLLIFDNVLTAFYPTYLDAKEFLLTRFSDQRLQSERFHLTEYWYQQFLSNPLKPVRFPSNSPTSWFHNFWMDFQSNAGSAAFAFLLLQNIIGLFVFFKLVVYCDHNKVQWLVYFVAVFICLYTSPEQLFSPFFLILLSLFLLAARLSRACTYKKRLANSA